MNIHEPLKVNFDGEYYRYTVGEFNTSAQCSAYVKFLQSKGFADAFVRKYVGDEPEK
jgi:cell division protein FtsN